jgi:PhnB protein
MPKRSLNHGPNDTRKIEQLNRAVDLLLARADGKLPKLEASVEPLVRVAADLRDLPRQSFKEKLKAEFEGRKTMATTTAPVAAVRTFASPRLSYKSAAKAIEFYEKAFGAKESWRFENEGGIGHAEIIIGDTVVMLCEEYPEGGRFSPETWGHTSVSMSIQVLDVDAAVERAVAAGATLTTPATDQFYGYRDATVTDPFGYPWNLYTVKEEMSLEEMHRRFREMMGPPKAKPAIPRGFQTLTTYLVAQDADALVNFVKQTFDAEETLRVGPGSEGGMHCEVRLGDSKLMIGGGGPGFAWKGDPKPGAFHVYVRDCDAVYRRALDAGGTSLDEPADQSYGERSASVVDAAGNHWYIATYKGKNYKWEGAPDVQPYLHPLRAEPVINFLKRAFGAEELGRYAAPDGVIHHATLKIGTSHLELGEAHGKYQPMKSMFYLYVPDVDAMYKRAIAAGATSIHEPKDQPYGDRVGAVADAFGNQWYMGTPVKNVEL